MKSKKFFEPGKKQTKKKKQNRLVNKNLLPSAFDSTTIDTTLATSQTSTRPIKPIFWSWTGTQEIFFSVNN